MKPYSVLMIDDDPTSIERVQQYLDRDSYIFDSSTDPFLGIEKAKELKPDIIVLDIEMTLPGYEVCRRLHANKSTQDIPIIMYSVHGDEDEAFSHSLNLGVFAVVPKGSLMRLVAAIDRFVRKEIEHNPQITVYFREGHELKIQGAAERVWLDGKEKFLRPMTRRLLTSLTAQPGILLSSKDLLKIAYAEEDAFNRGSGDIHRLMHDLRNEIEPNPQKPLFIESKKRVGYRITTDEPGPSIQI